MKGQEDGFVIDWLSTFDLLKARFKLTAWKKNSIDTVIVSIKIEIFLTGTIKLHFTLISHKSFKNYFIFIENIKCYPIVYISGKLIFKE